MKITDEKWNEIVTATREGIERWNAKAKEKNRPDTFHCEVKTAGPYAVLITTHVDGELSTRERKSVARESSSGEMRPVKLKRHNGQLSITVKGGDPKGWQNVNNKPVGEVVKQLKLLNFFMVVSAQLVSATATCSSGGVRTSFSTGMIFGGQKFGPEETEALETICRERKVSMTEAVEIFRAKS